MQAEKTTINLPSREIIEKVKSKLWRVSHSLKTLDTFECALKKFENYLQVKQVNYTDVIKSPLDILDDLSAWLDADLGSGTVRTYVAYIKKLLIVDNVQIDHYQFREKVTLPKPKSFEDDKVSEDQIRRIILAAKHAKLKNVSMLMKDTQIRPKEALGLQLQDFNLAHEPPYLNIPAYLAKNDIPRELFFTPETKSMLLAYIKNKGISKANDFVFLDQDVDPMNEMEFQRILGQDVGILANMLRYTLRKPEFSDMNVLVKQKGKAKRYKIHIYSFKKFAFTKMADALGEIAARAIKGDKKYVFTYYKKSREERAEDYRKMIPKLSVFLPDHQARIRDQVEEAIKTLDKQDLVRLLEFIKNGNNPASK